MIRALDRATTARLGRTFSAQAYSQAVTIGVQIALVPLLLHAWGAGLYGAWLLLSAIPFYLTFSDFGFTFVAKNEMVMAVSRGRRDAALATFQSIFVLLCLAGPLLLAITALGAFAVDPAALLAIPGVSTDAARAVLLLLIVNVLLYQFFMLICAGIRAENRPASEAVWAASARLGEGVAVALAAMAGGGIVGAAMAMVVARALFLIAGYGWLRRLSRWLCFGTDAASRAELRRLWSPAMAYMAMPLAQALLIQGPVLAVGSALGPAAVVVFATSRTMARIGTAGINMLNNSVVSEYSALAGARARGGFTRLLRLQVIISLFAIVAYSMFVTVAAPFLLPLLTHGAVQVGQPFFLVVTAGVAAEMLWSALFTPLAAVNRHRIATIAFLIAASAALAMCRPLIDAFGLSGAAFAVLFAHAVMIPLCVALMRRQLAPAR